MSAPTGTRGGRVPVGAQGVAAAGDWAQAIKAAPDHLGPFPVVAASAALKCLGFATCRGGSWRPVTGSERRLLERDRDVG